MTVFARADFGRRSVAWLLAHKLKQSLRPELWMLRGRLIPKVLEMERRHPVEAPFGTSNWTMRTWVGVPTAR
jgi:hypothetical protein